MHVDCVWTAAAQRYIAANEAFGEDRDVGIECGTAMWPSSGRANRGRGMLFPPMN